MDIPGVFRKACSPHTKPRPKDWPEGLEYVDDGFANDAERQFNQLALENGVVCDVESVCFGATEADGVEVEIYRPDFRMMLWNPETQELEEIFVEIHGAKKWRRNNYTIRNKRAKIRWLSQRTGIPVILLHLHTWPDPRNDWSLIETMAALARFEAQKVHREFILAQAQRSLPCITDAALAS